MLFNEPKLLKFVDLCWSVQTRARASFSALQRAEIAEIKPNVTLNAVCVDSFSALQRAEIAEIVNNRLTVARLVECFSALQRAEIAEMREPLCRAGQAVRFQCSSTSRNC